jgi:SAM-dependent methyltransferase
MKEIPIEQHNTEIQSNLESWNKKSLLQEIYKGFYKQILSFVKRDLTGEILELGSGIGNFKMVCPQSVSTDIFPNPWIDRVESAYHLSNETGSVSHILMFDVFHHLRYPGLALQECLRALKPGGRLIIFDPCISLLGFLVYGVVHHEPVAWNDEIEWFPKKENANPDASYYAAQGNATRIFRKKSPYIAEIKKEWKMVRVKKLSTLSYVLSGGFSKPALYPRFLLPVLKIIENIFDLFPLIFATRILIVLEKK